MSIILYSFIHSAAAWRPSSP